MKVLISGAGIGGLAAARALIADGHQVTVFEQAAGLRPGGAAVTLWSNGTGVLSSLGVSLAGAGAPVELMQTRDRQGRVLLSIDVAQAAARYGYPHVCLPRARLLRLLADGLPPGTVQFGRAASAARASAQPSAPGGDAHVGGASGGDGPPAVRLTFADGTSVTGDALVAADGRGSALRNQLWGGDPGRPAGWATWQGLSALKADIPDRASVLFVGPPGSCGLMAAGDGLLQWWFDLRWTPGTPVPAAPVAMLRERFAGWAPAVRQVLESVTDAETGFFPHYRHRVPRTWGHGPVTVIGDAAHAMPPTRAQGANQALEDAWALAAALRPQAGAGGRAASPGATAVDPAVTAAALRSFERRRSARVAIVSRQAGREDYNRFGATLSRLTPAPLASRYYARWLGQVSSFLDAR
jgi:FAD-dependent urate hydroxylase